jgi:enoyl-CoA hydratase/carnithine racemase
MNQSVDPSVWASRAEIHSHLENGIGFIALNRPKALNALSTGMVRAIKVALDRWRDDPEVLAVVIYSPHARAFCAGGDIRFLYDAHQRGDAAAIDAFFTDEYRLNHTIFYYPKPYIALMNGVVMGGGMGISQGAAQTGGLRIVTAGARLAMPETKIGLFPDVGASWFLARTPAYLGTYLGVSGNMIQAADALHAGLADLSVPEAAWAAMFDSLSTTPFAAGAEVVAHLKATAEAANQGQVQAPSMLAEHGAAIAQHFALDSMAAIVASLESSADAWAAEVLADLRARSPLSMAVSLELIRRAATLSMADCLRTDLDLVRSSFASGDIVEGIRAVIVDKDHAPQWQPAHIHHVSAAAVAEMFVSAWPAQHHPLAALQDA